MFREYSSVIKYVPSMLEALGLVDPQQIPSKVKNKQKRIVPPFFIFHGPEMISVRKNKAEE